VALQEPETAAVELAAFVSALHRPAPGDAPRNPFREEPLAGRTPAVHERVRQVAGSIDADAVLRAWERAVRTRLWPGPPLWIHGDLHPFNLLVRDTHIAAVLDFGDLTAGDPATDLSVAWTLLPQSSRATFRAATRELDAEIDQDTWTRARGWALSFGLLFLASSRDNAVMHAFGRRTIEAVLTDELTSA
jgi:aminoglycoside phosphotransferase (APT) family kinase protein